MKLKLTLVLFALFTSTTSFAGMLAFKFDCTVTSQGTISTGHAGETVWLTDGVGVMNTTMLINRYQGSVDLDMNLTKTGGSTARISIEDTQNTSVVLAEVVSTLHLDGLDQVKLTYTTPDKADSFTITCGFQPSTEPAPASATAAGSTSQL